MEALLVRRRSSWTTAAGIGLALVLTTTGCGDDKAEKKTSEGSTSGAVESGKEKDAGKPVPGGEISYSLEAETSGGYCLPTSQLAAAGITTANAVFDSLYNFDAEFKPIPFLAESDSWNADFTQLTIKIRQGVKFHDGSDLTAQTVARNLNLLRGEATIVAETGLSPLLTRFVFQNIANVEATDASTVVVTTTTPWPALPEFLATGRYGIIAEAQMAAGKDGCATNMIGTGPFKLVSWKIGDEMKLERNPNYWRKDADGVQLPYLDKLNFRFFEGGSSRFDALDGGTIDAGHWSTQSIFDEISTDDRFQLIAEGKGRKEVAYGLTNVDTAPLNDIEVRRHMGMAIDRDTLNEINSSSVFKVANGPFDTDVMGYLEEPGNVQYDKAAAAAFFEGKNISFELTYATDPTLQAIANDVKRQLGEVGVTVTVNELDQASLIDKALGGKFNVLLWRNHMGADPDTQYVWWHSGLPTNFGKINDPKIDSLLEQGRVESDPAKRRAIYEDLNRAFAAGAYNLWNWYTEWGIGARKEIHGLTSATMPDGSPGSGLRWGINRFDETWVEQ